jgi:hypothetical protein
MLGDEVDKKNNTIKRLETNNKILKYTAIVAGTLALSASTYIIVR